MNIIISRQPMISGQGEAVANEYLTFTDKSGRTWLYTDRDNSADNIYVSNPDNKNGEGFGGATLGLPLKGGGTFPLRGGWHSNADALFTSTGIDLREKYTTYVVIGKGRFYTDRGETVIEDIVYQDSEPMIGSFYRGDVLAKQIANELQLEVYLYSGSKGGSSCGKVTPD